MVRVNIDSAFWSDGRFDYFASLLGEETVPDHLKKHWLSRYRVLLLWSACYNKRTDRLNAKQIAYACQFTGDPQQLIDALVESDIVSIDGDDIIVKGVDGRIAYLKSQSQRGKRGGRPKKQTLSNVKAKIEEPLSEKKANASKCKSLPLDIPLPLPLPLPPDISPDKKNTIQPTFAPLTGGDCFSDTGEAEQGKPPEGRPEKQTAKAKVPDRPPGVSEQVWSDFLACRRQQKAPLTETALQGIVREAAKAGISLEAALAECVLRGWRGFKADWVAGKSLAADIPKPDEPIDWTNGGRL